MRTLDPAPSAFPPGSPRVGSYVGPLPPIDLGRALGDRILRRKKWFYVAIASDTVWISLAVVRTGYATTAFAFVTDRKRMIAERTVFGPPTAGMVTDDPAQGALASLRVGATHFALDRRGSFVDVRVHIKDLEIDAELDLDGSPPAISAVASLGPQLVTATEKRALARVRGRVVIAERARSLDNALGGYDYSHGLMPRRTRWRWAFAMGKTNEGPFAFNLTSGFVGEAECAAFQARVHPLAEPTFHFDPHHPERPWTLRGDGVDLVFFPDAVHEQRTNLLVVRSRFLQPAGTFRGTLRVDGRNVPVDGMPGVVEDQDSLW